MLRDGGSADREPGGAGVLHRADLLGANIPLVPQLPGLGLQAAALFILRANQLTMVESRVNDLNLSFPQAGFDGRVLIAQRPQGKSMAGLIDMVGSGEIARDSTVLYAPLGGQPVLSAYAGVLT